MIIMMKVPIKSVKTLSAVAYSKIWKTNIISRRSKVGESKRA